MRTAMTFALFLALTTACKKDKKPEGDTKGSATMQGSDKEKPKAGSNDAGSGSGSGSAGSGSATADAGSGSAGAGSGEPKGPKLEGTHGGGNCPSMVLGAETKAEMKGKDIVLTITSTDKDAVATIQKRGEELLKEKKDAPTGKVHDQKGSQGGAMGICPVYWPEGGKAASKKEANGIVITITPKEKPEELKKTIDERITKVGEWVKANIKPGDAGNKGGVGGGKGEHGGTHSGSGDGKGKDRKAGSGSGGDGKGGGAGTGGGGGKGTGGGGGKGTGAEKKPNDKGGAGW